MAYKLSRLSLTSALPRARLGFELELIQLMMTGTVLEISHQSSSNGPWFDLPPRVRRGWQCPALDLFQLINARFFSATGKSTFVILQATPRFSIFNDLPPS